MSNFFFFCRVLKSATAVRSLTTSHMLDLPMLIKSIIYLSGPMFHSELRGLRKIYLISLYLNIRPATHTDFISIYRFFMLKTWQNTDFLLKNLAKYRFSSLKFGKIQIFFFKIWQNTDFYWNAKGFFSYFL